MLRLACLLLLVSLAGCSEEKRECPTGALFSVTPAHPDSIRNIDPLGNLNPTGHVFPSDHGGAYIKNRPDGMAPYNVQFFCPGDITVVRLRALEHLHAGITDFAIDYECCEEIFGYLGHISSLNPEVFGSVADYTEWTLDSEYSTGGETFRHYVRTLNLDVAAGLRLGTVGGNPGQGGFDFGIIDRTAAPVTAARPSRWGTYPYARFFLDYYEDGPAKDALTALINREDIPGDPYPGGRALQDVPGTAHGCWFLPGAPHPPEDEHLALVQGHIFPSRLAFSVGTSIPSLPPSVWMFEPVDDGRLNRAFEDVTSDGQVYAYHVEYPERTVLLTMPDADTVRIEAVDGHLTDPASWVLSDQAVAFER